MRTHLFLGASLLMFLPSQATAQVSGETAQVENDASARPELSASVSFGRSTIRQEDSVPVRIWIDSRGTTDVENVALHIASPEFVAWHEGPSCDADPVPDPMRLGPVPADSVLFLDLCARTGTELAVGRFNVLFTFQYEWLVDGRRRTSIVTAEKELDASLFGSDDVAGVPIALAVFIVPGLIFWLVVGLLNVPWRQNNAPLGSQMIYSVLASVAILIVVQWLGSIGGSAGWIDADGGHVSIEKLRNLALIGLVTGLVIGGADRVVRSIRTYFRKQEESYRIHPDDEPTLLLEKVLAAYSTDHPGLSEIVLKDGEVIAGSLAKREAAFTAVIAWFQIDLEEVPEDAAATFRALERAGRLRELVNEARRGRVEITPRDVLNKSGGAPLEGRDLYIRVERTENVTEVRTVQPEAGREVEMPVVLL